MKRLAYSTLWVALVAQFAWLGIERMHSQRGWNELLYPLFVTIGFTALALARERFRLIPAALRIFVGIAFVSAICDRLGLFGGPGAPGVSWGNFQNFVYYTAQVNSFLPRRIIPALAVVESFIEGGLGITMLLGLEVRPVSIASAALLSVLGVAMTVSLGVSSQFSFAVFVLAAGTFVIANVDATLLSLDAVRARLKRRRSAA
jgi:hypothetical protein